jgi:pimeloyl-ACP methyl ester carboxylesterase
MNKISSKDGTLLAYRHAGVGSPLLLVHGTGGSSARWLPLFPLLEKHFGIYALDRRGRGDSGDAPDYVLEREFEDVASVVDSLGGPVILLGHSFGGLCALEAALLTPHIRKLILYEAPIPVEAAPDYPDQLIDRLDALLSAGDREAVLTAFMQEIVHMKSNEIELSRSSASWPARVAAAHTLPRELRAQRHYRFAPERFKSLKTPTLFLLGGESPLFFESSAGLLNATLPDCRIVVLPGQGHMAMDTAPDLFVSEVMKFLEE